MNWKYTVVLGLVGGALVTFLARAATSTLAPPPLVPAPAQAPLDDPAALFADVDRLRERLRPPVASAVPSRNLFSFRQAAALRSDAAQASAGEAAAVPTPPTPVSATSALPFSLIGLAEDGVEPGAKRTAILAGAGGLHFAEVGTVVAGYRLTAIRDAAVELTAVDEAEAGPAIVLTFK